MKFMKILIEGIVILKYIFRCFFRDIQIYINIIFIRIREKILLESVGFLFEKKVFFLVQIKRKLWVKKF